MWELVRANQRRAAILVGVMAGLLLALGYALGELAAPGAGGFGLVVAFAVWVVMALVSFNGGDRILLATSRARPIEKQDHPVLWNVVEEMTIAAGLPKPPAVYILDEDAPNAFATGRDPEHASIAVTAGLLERLTRDELQGVVAHELGHIRNRDILYLTVAAIMMGTIVLLADLGARWMFWGGGRRTSSDRGGGAQAILLAVSLLLMILAPIFAQLLYFALSRRREYLADASSAIYTRYPKGLADALEKISGSTQRLRAANRTTAPMYIVNPLKVSAHGLADLTSTHPPTSERIRILRSMAGGEIGWASYDDAYRTVSGRPVGVVPAGSLAAAQATEERPPTPDPRSRLDRVRATTDALWGLHGYTFLTCACGTALKVPPAHRGKTIPCPQCGRPHTVGSPRNRSGDSAVT